MESRERPVLPSAFARRISIRVGMFPDIL